MELDGASAKLLWPRLDGARADEQLFLLQTPGGRPLELGCNFPYEVWCDGEFAGDGGWRCAPGEVQLDRWDARLAGSVQVRVHHLDPRRSSVCYRCLFADPFFVDLGGGEWSCHRDVSVRFAAKMASQLARQNVVSGPPAPGGSLALESVRPGRQWRAHTPGLLAARYVPVLLGSGRAHALEAGADRSFDPAGSDNVAAYVREFSYRDAACTTFDLGHIALHRFEVECQGPLALCYGEVPELGETWVTANRRKVLLSDAFEPGVKGGAPFGTRGCRFVNVVHRRGEGFSLKAWRREYPPRWKPLRIGDPVLASVLLACRNNLVACVDGGVVDTCWRERAQWVGDLRMSGLALSALADNPEVVPYALSQIATSYEDGPAMVQGAWPVKHEHNRDLLMPTYHLAFCLTVLEQCPGDGRLRGLVERSLRRWQAQYVTDGLLRDLPGWHLTDWDPADPDAAARSFPGRAHAVANAWYHEACTRLGLPTIDLDRFEEVFWLPGEGAYRLVEGGGPSPHATAAPLSSLPVPSEPGYLLDDRNLLGRVTLYFGYFVARAIGRSSRVEMLDFVKRFYGPIAARHGTIVEKTGDHASLAHGWSVGVASLIASGEETIPRAPEPGAGR